MLLDFLSFDKADKRENSGQEAEEAEEMDPVMNADILADYRSRISEHGRHAGRLCIELYCGKGTAFERELLARYPALLDPEDPH